MTDKTIELNRRRVLGGMITLGGAAAAAGAGTFAYFSDTAESTGNDIVSGTLTLESATSGALTVENLAPSQSAPESGTTTISTTYDSDSTIDPAEADVDIALSEPDEPTEPANSSDQTPGDFASQLNVDTANLVKNGSAVEDLTSTESVSTVADLGGSTIDAAYGGISPGDSIGLELAATMDSDAGNAYQADGVTIDVTFTAEQQDRD